VNKPQGAPGEKVSPVVPKVSPPNKGFFLKKMEWPPSKIIYEGPKKGGSQKEF